MVIARVENESVYFWYVLTIYADGGIHVSSINMHTCCTGCSLFVSQENHASQMSDEAISDIITF